MDTNTREISHKKNIMQRNLRLSREKVRNHQRIYYLLYLTDERATRLPGFKFLFPMTPTKIIPMNSWWTEEAEVICCCKKLQLRALD